MISEPSGLAANQKVSGTNVNYTACGNVTLRTSSFVWNAPVLNWPPQYKAQTHVHAEIPYNKLLQGLTLDEAAQSANEQEQLYTDNPTQAEMPEDIEVSMKIHGDPMATIVGVYTGPKLSSRPWYKVF